MKALDKFSNEIRKLEETLKTDKRNEFAINDILDDIREFIKFTKRRIECRVFTEN